MERRRGDGFIDSTASLNEIIEHDKQQNNKQTGAAGQGERTPTNVQSNFLPDTSPTPTDVFSSQQRLGDLFTQEEGGAGATLGQSILGLPSMLLNYLPGGRPSSGGGTGVLRQRDTPGS